MIYIANSMMGDSTVSLPYPGIYFGRKLQKVFPKLPSIWNERCTSIYEVQIIDTR